MYISGLLRFLFFLFFDFQTFEFLFFPMRNFHSSTPDPRGGLYEGPGVRSMRNGPSAWTPQGPGQCLALVTRGWRHS